MLHPEFLQQKVEHAQWRVEFVRSLLELHQNAFRTHDWKEKEAVLLARIADAEKELQRLRAQVSEAA